MDHHVTSSHVELLTGSDTVIGLFVIALLVFLNGFFVAAEFALVKVRESRMRVLARQNKFGSKVSLQIIQHLNVYLSACQLGITIASLALGWEAEKTLTPVLVPIMDKIFGMENPFFSLTLVRSAIIFSIITFLHIVTGEQAPKVWAIQNAEFATRWVAWPLRIFYFISYPGIWLLNASSEGLLKLLRMEEVDEHAATHTPDELRMLLRQSHQNNSLTPVAGSLLINALDLRKRTARQVMVHRTRMTCLYTHHSLEDNLRAARESRHSRFPLCSQTKDHIVGMIYLKDLFWLYQDSGVHGNITSIKRDILMLPEMMPLERVLNTFLTRRIHMAVLVDEYGSIVGILTLENILEELVGNIQELDEQELLMFQKISDAHYRLHGELALHDLDDSMGLSLNPEDVTTIGGYLVQILGHFPKINESVRIGDWEFTVLKTRGHQILQIDARKMGKPEPVGFYESGGSL